MSSPPKDTSPSQENKPKWTPGPWHWVDSETDVPGFELSSYMSLRTVEEWQAPYSEFTLPKFIVEVECGGFDRQEDDEAVANAHLIAAAPDLYEALEPLDEWATEHVVEATEWSPRTTVRIQLSIGELRAIRAALAKARGEK